MGVRMRHPTLPADQTVEVDERLVAGHRAAGWVVVDTPTQPEEAPAVDEDSPATAGDMSEPAPEKPSRRRTTPKEGEEQ